MRIPAACATLILVPSVLGQRVLPPVRVHAAPNPGDHEYIETAVAVGGLSANHVLAAWLDRTSPGFVRYAVSLDAGRTFVDAVLKPPECVPGAPPATFADPMVASSPTTDDLWVGGVLIGVQQQAVNVWRIPAGTAAPAVASAVECRADRFGRPLDKPFIAVGPRVDLPAVETMYAFFTDFAPDAQGLLFGKVAQDAKMLLWPSARLDVRRTQPPPGVNEEGVAIVPVVLTGSPHRGRVVCIWRPSQPTMGTPVVMSSDDGGKSWLPAAPIPLDHAGADPIRPVEPSDLPGAGLGISQNTIPWIAASPVDSRLVYATFWGVGDPQNDTNVDIFIARSVDGGATFDPKNTVRLTDALLGDVAPAGAPPVDQILPAIAIDRFGGVNILYYALLDTGGSYTAQPKWARISGLSGVIGAGDIQTKVLGPAFPRPTLNDGSIGILKEYQMIAASGSVLYACYMSAHEGPMNIYVSKIDLSPLDVDGDGIPDGRDIGAFVGALANGLPEADVNDDHAVDGADVEAFLASLRCGGAP
jgi:hypothetical protein